MKTIRQTTSFNKDLKRMSRRNKDLRKIYFIVEKLVKGERLEKQFLAHKLTGNYSDKWEAHVDPDWLLIYEVLGDIIVLYRTGSHADLFA